MADDNEPVETNHQTDGEGAQLAAVSLIGGVRDFFLRNVRENGMKKPWGKMSEKEQEMEINRATERAEQLVRDIVDIVAQGDFPVVHAIIDNFKIKDGEVTITSKGIADDQVLLSLNHAGKKAVKIVVADAGQFDKERTHVAPDPDEPGLPGVKKDLTAGEVNGEPPAFEDDDDATFDDDAEQAEGDQILSAVEHSDQWWGGYNSRMGGHDVKDNPFDGRSTDGKDWKAGWTEADGREDAPEVKVVDEPAHDPATGEIIEDEPEPCDCADRAPVGEYYRCPKCDAEWPPEEEPDAIDELLDEDRGEAPEDEEQPDPTEDEIWDITEAGKKARADGHGPGSCPYPSGSKRMNAWLKGYHAQKAVEPKPGEDADFED